MKNNISFEKLSPSKVLAIIAIIASYFFISVYVIPEYSASVAEYLKSPISDYYITYFDMPVKK